MNHSKNKLDELRKEIDSIDSRLLKLFNERARHAIEIGVIKSNENQEIYDPEREIEIIKKFINRQAGILISIRINIASFTCYLEQFLRHINI